MDTGHLISFEGLDGAGKTTQISLLEHWLQARHVSYICTREPGGTPLGAEIRHLLLHRPELAITPLTETLLFQADRAQHFDTIVLPALQAGTLVITDRCFDASIAYQSFARGIKLDLIEDLSLLTMQGHLPDLTILLDLDPAKVSARTDAAQGGSREEQTRFDTEAEHFHRRVQEGFHFLARTYPKRIKVVDACRTPETIHQEVVSLVKPLLPS